MPVAVRVMPVAVRVLAVAVFTHVAPLDLRLNVPAYLEKYTPLSAGEIRRTFVSPHRAS
jgi:hypothetical protein